MTAAEPVIAVSDLTRRFGARAALSSVTLTIPRGGVYGLIGANGAGKTTLIRHILGLLRPQQGSVRVFGRDPVADPVGVLSRIGYLSEENDLPDWMRVDELMRYTRAFYPRWDDSYAGELQTMFALDPAAKIKTLSKGQKARVGLVVALAYRPELLLLDNPLPASIHSCAATSSAPCSEPSRTKGAPCCSHRTCWRRSRGWPIT